MIKNKTTLEIKKQDKTYQFTCDPDSSLSEVYDCLLEMINFVFGKIEASKPKKLTEKDEKKECEKNECCSQAS